MKRKLLYTILICFDILLFVLLVRTSSSFYRGIYVAMPSAPSVCKELLLGENLTKSDRIHILAGAVDTGFFTKNTSLEIKETDSSCNPILDLIKEINLDKSLVSSIQKFAMLNVYRDELADQISELSALSKIEILNFTDIKSAIRTDARLSDQNIKSVLIEIVSLNKKVKKVDENIFNDSKIIKLNRYLDNITLAKRKLLAGKQKARPYYILGGLLLFSVFNFLLVFYLSSLLRKRYYKKKFYLGQIVFTNIRAVSIVYFIFILLSLFYLRYKDFSKGNLNFASKGFAYFIAIVLLISFTTIVLNFLYKKGKDIINKSYMFGRLCINCAKKLPENANVCPYCGELQHVICKHCNKKTYKYADYCTECGYKLKPGSEKMFS